MHPAEVNLHVITLSVVMLLKLFEQQKKLQKTEIVFYYIVQMYVLLNLKRKNVSCWLECIYIIVA